MKAKLLLVLAAFLLFPALVIAGGVASAKPYWPFVPVPRKVHRLRYSFRINVNEEGKILSSHTRLYGIRGSHYGIEFNIYGQCLRYEDPVC